MNCRLCGGEVRQSYYQDVQTEMNSRQLCFDCNFWQEKADCANDPASVRINGVQYFIGKEVLPTDPDKWWRGFGGRRFVVAFSDGRVVETTNLWCSGDIPEHFREKLPDNACFADRNLQWVEVCGQKVLTEVPERPADRIFPEAARRKTEHLCATCGKPIGIFRDALSAKEFTISGMCQECQDEWECQDE